MYLELDFTNSRPDFTQTFTTKKSEFRLLPADFMNAGKLAKEFKGTKAPGFGKYRHKMLVASSEEFRITNPRSDKWVAQWSSSCDYKKPYGMWQYTDSWTIGGKSFDGNYAYKDYPSLIDPQEKEEDDMTEAQVKAIAEKAIADYFAGLEKKKIGRAHV